MVATTRSENPDLFAVILAAGGSSRLGTAKQLVRYRGRALLRRAVDAARAVAPAKIVVVVGADALRMRALLMRSHAGAVQVAHNARWGEGLATSLSSGLACAPPGVRAALVLLADQPLVDASSVRRLRAAWRQRPARPAAAHYSGRLGVPAILPRALWKPLAREHGDRGARRILQAAAAVTAVRMPEAAVDVDVPEDLARLTGAGAPAPKTLRG